MYRSQRGTSGEPEKPGAKESGESGESGDKGVMKIIPVEQTKKLKAIREALRSARRVWLATDCDREGQLIGQETLEHYAPFTWIGPH